MTSSRLQSMLSLKRYIPLLLLLFLGKGLDAQHLTCADFRSGSFLIKDEERETRVTRRDHMQIELSAKGPSYFEVEWLSDCSYTLTPSDETLLETYGVLTVEIVSITKQTAKIKGRMSALPDFLYEAHMEKVVD